MMHRAFVIAIATLIIPFTAIAFTVPKADVVVDQVGILKNIDQIKSSLVDYQQKTGHETGVLIVPTLGDEPIEDVANQVFRAWGIGNEKRDDGVLILVAIDDHNARIEVGYGMEGALPDITAKEVLDTVMFPLFKQNKYEEGIVAGIQSIESSVAGEPIFPQSSGSESAPINPVFLIAVAWFVGGILWRLFGRSKAWWHGGIAGGIVGGIAALIIGTLTWSLIAIIGGTLMGLLFDFIASKFYKEPPAGGHGPGGPWFFGGGGGSSFGGGGFGGFGGGSSGGGGAGGRW